MSDNTPITDEKSLEAWLKTQPREVSVWIAFRAAARVLPIWWVETRRNQALKRRDFTALPVLRSLSTSALFAYTEDADVCSRQAEAADAASAAAKATAGHTVAAPTRAALAAVNASIRTAYIAVARTAALAAARATVRAAAAADATAIWDSVTQDKNLIAQGWPPTPTPLWPGENPLRETWFATLAALDTDNARQDWTFWIAWYESLLNGTLMLPDAQAHQSLLEEIALSDQIDWDDPKAANQTINEIWERYRLLSDTRAIQREVASAETLAQAAQARIGHNNPPELLDDPVQAFQTFTIALTEVKATLVLAETELAKPAPAPSNLQRIGKALECAAYALIRAAKAVVIYLAEISDLALRETIKKAAGPVGTMAGSIAVDKWLLGGQILNLATRLMGFGP